MRFVVWYVEKNCGSASLVSEEFRRFCGRSLVVVVVFFYFIFFIFKWWVLVENCFSPAQIDGILALMTMMVIK